MISSCLRCRYAWIDQRSSADDTSSARRLNSAMSSANSEKFHKPCVLCKDIRRPCFYFRRAPSAGSIQWSTAPVSYRAGSQFTSPLLERRFRTLLRALGNTQQLVRVAQIAASAIASADALPFPKPTRLQFAFANSAIPTMLREMAAPQGDRSLTFKGGSFHTGSGAPMSLRELGPQFYLRPIRTC